MVEIEKRCAQLLRELRKKRGLTLRECEEASNGRFKAVVVGSYERGTRAISIERLQELADFYQVPIQYFFEVGQKSVKSEISRYIFDLRKLEQSRTFDKSLERTAQVLLYFTRLRGDWNGEVLSIRSSDGDLLPLMTEDSHIVTKLLHYKIAITPSS